MIDERSLLLWAHCVLAWAVTNYAFFEPRPLKWLIIQGASVTILVWTLSDSIVLTILLLLTTVALSGARRRLPPDRAAEREVVGILVSGLGSIVLIANLGLQLARPLFALPASGTRISATCLVAALFLFTIHGGTYIVRGILEKSGAVPSRKGGNEGSASITETEFRRGRIIGGLERAVLFVVIIVGSYEALGFIIAAKGLIRSRELETDRDLTEYFLIGTLRASRLH